MRKAAPILFLLIAVSASGADLAFDHVWIEVSPGAPERKVLQRAGFTIAPEVNRHDGQGTASITIEFENAFLELMWPDKAVPVAPGLERANEKFRKRMEWRTSGWSPFGIGFRRAGDGEVSLPFPTWSVNAGWLPAGSSIVMMTPRDDTTSPSFFISPRELSENQAARFKPHKIGVKRVTGVRLIAPKAYQPIDAAVYLEKAGLLRIDRGTAWTLELSFDDGHRFRDFRPTLPLMIRY